MEAQILELLKEHGFVEMQSEDHWLSIHFKKFFGTEKEWLFILNAKPIFDCKTKRTAIKKIKHFLDRGLKLVEE